MFDLMISKTVSIVVPFHNEELNVTELYSRLCAVMEDTGWGYQFVFVDDGSTDLTYKLLKEIALIDPRVTIVKLRRNFGQTAALAAGFAHCNGGYVIAMDGDLQHDPADIPKFLEKLEEGYDLVSGWRKHRIDNFWLRRIPSRCANWLMAKLSGVNIHDFGTTFKAYRGEMLHELPLYGEMHRFIPALASAYGASICEIPIHNSHRKHGISHYNLSRTFRVMFDLHHDSVSSALHVTPAALFWSTRAHEYDCGFSDSVLACRMEGHLWNEHRAATRIADGVCRDADPGRPSTAGLRAAG